MALQSSGQISLQDIMTELGISGQTALNDSDVRALINKSAGAQMSISEWYGASSGVTLSVNGLQLVASSFIDSGGTLIIDSGIYVWSDNPLTAGLTVDIPCTIVNKGFIMGKGGEGGRGRYGKNASTSQAGNPGGPGISITSTGVTIKNESYIGGGGGGGQGSRGSSNGSGGGGGAGGGSAWADGGNGGAIGSAGNNGNSYGGQGNLAQGGGAGGGGGSVRWQRAGSNSITYNEANTAAGGGRIMPGNGGAKASRGHSNGGGGGSAAGDDGTNRFTVPNLTGNFESSWGGGGWGASGGGWMTTNIFPFVEGAGSGGAAIDASQSYTLTNTGTIYGAT